MNQEINDNTRSDQKCYIEDSENPVGQFQTPSAETTITTEIPTLDELEEGIVIAPGKAHQYYMMNTVRKWSIQIYSQQVNLVIKSSGNFT